MMKEIPEEPMLLDAEQLKILQRERKWPDSWWVSVNHRIEPSPVSLGTALTLKKAYPDRLLYVANVEDRGVPQEWIELSTVPTRTPWPKGKPTSASSVETHDVKAAPTSAQTSPAQPVAASPARGGGKVLLAAGLFVGAGVMAWLLTRPGETSPPPETASAVTPLPPAVALPPSQAAPLAPPPPPEPTPAHQPEKAVLVPAPSVPPAQLLAEARASATAAASYWTKLRVEELAPDKVAPLLLAENRASQLEKDGDLAGAAAAWSRVAEGRSRAALAAASKLARQAMDTLSLENVRDYDSVHWAALDAAMARVDNPGSLPDAVNEVAKVPALVELLRTDLLRQLSEQAARFENGKKLPLARRSWLSVLRLNPAHPAALSFLNANLRDPGPAHTNSLGAVFHFIPAGTYRRGSPPAERGRDSDENRHQVTLTRAFLIGRHEVTVAEWRRVMGSDPMAKQGVSTQAAPEASPVTGVSWREAVDFCDRLCRLENRRYRLPTEAEWEYACRAGTETAWPQGEEEPGRNLAEFALPGAKPAEFPSPVGTVGKPNAWGLHGMCGGVWEWCLDWSAPYPAKAVTNPSGPADSELDPLDSLRVLRGGSWMDPAVQGRSANRFEAAPAAPPRSAGLRLVLEIGPEHFPSLFN